MVVPNIVFIPNALLLAKQLYAVPKHNLKLSLSGDRKAQEFRHMFLDEIVRATSIS